MTDKIDDKIRELFNVLENKKNEVQQAETDAKQSWVTSGSLSIHGEAPTNLQTAAESTIVDIVARLLQVKDYRQRAAEILGTEADSKIHGYSFDQWISDCKKRLAKISLTAKKSDLAKLETRLNGIISPEQRRAMELEAITKELL